MLITRRFSFIFIILIIVVLNIDAQLKTVSPSFRSPVDIPIRLAGNFGEIRGSHFHTGIDIKTQGVEGKNVYSIEDGYVSRIKISSGGSGNAMYITH